jgi:alanine dehydrogenase
MQVGLIKPLYPYEKRVALLPHEFVLYNIRQNVIYFVS